MTSAMQTDAALLWREILRRDPKALFGNQADQLLDRNWGDRIPQPGYVGREYRRGGLVFVSMNPGGGPNQGLGENNLRQYRVLKDLRESSPTRALAVFRELNDLLAEIMPKWKIYENFVLPVIQPARLTFSRVAYLNLLKWRTKKSSRLARLYDLSWRDHTQAQFDLLKPNIVVAIGVNAGKAFARHHPNEVHFDVIPRVIGNNVGQPGREAIARISGWLSEHLRDVT